MKAAEHDHRALIASTLWFEATRDLDFAAGVRQATKIEADELREFADLQHIDLNDANAVMALRAEAASLILELEEEVDGDHCVRVTIPDGKWIAYVLGTAGFRDDEPPYVVRLVQNLRALPSVLKVIGFSV